MDIFYDFDGTLFDTYPMMVKAFSQMAQDFKVEIDPVAVYHQMRQGSLGGAMKNFAEQSDLDQKEADHRFRAIEASILMNSKPFPFVKNVLISVVKNGGRNYLLTHRNQATLDLLAKYQLQGLFTDFVTGDMDFPRKPNPASLQYLIDRNQVEKKSAYMIGDRNLDIDAAHNADIKGILFDPDQIINVSSNPEYQTTSFNGISDYLDKNLSNPL